MGGWGGGGGGGGGPFYKTVWQLKGFYKLKIHRNKFRYYCEIHACTNFHQKNTKFNLDKLK